MTLQLEEFRPDFLLAIYDLLNSLMESAKKRDNRGTAIWRTLREESIMAEACCPRWRSGSIAF
jgi:hypothetical protein